MYAVYDLMSYFSRQPTNIRCCPVCGNSLSESAIGPSRAVAVALSENCLIPVHDFSRLLRCRACPWWAVWESWSFRECNSQADFLIVAEGRGGVLDETNWQASPWSQVLKNEHIYDRAMPLPDDLGQLFLGGERIRISSVQENTQRPKRITMSNKGLSETSKIGGILNAFRRIQTRLLALFRKGAEPIFLKDELLGEFSGNILESIAKLFPPDAASKIEKAPPIRASWKVIERITTEGAREFIYYVSPGTSIQVLEVVSSIYQEKHRIKGYPGIFDGTKDHLPSFWLNAHDYFYNGKREIRVSEESFMIWLPEKVQGHASSA